MKGWRFGKYDDPGEFDHPFDRLLKIFQELLLHTSGDVHEALSWLTELDKQYQLTDNDYGIADFIKDLKSKGFIKEDGPNSQNFSPTSKMEVALRKSALNEIFDQLKKSKQGKHLSLIHI